MAFTRFATKNPELLYFDERRSFSMTFSLEKVHDAETEILAYKVLFQVLQFGSTKQASVFEKSWRRIDKFFQNADRLASRINEWARITKSNHFVGDATSGGSLRHRQ